MHDLGRDLGQGSEHVRTLEQIRTWQVYSGGLLDASPNSSTSRSMVRDAHLGAYRGRPHKVSMPRSRVITDSSGCAALKPTTRLMKSGPSKPTATLR
jgi:hypothetical protein